MYGIPWYTMVYPGVYHSVFFYIVFEIIIFYKILCIYRRSRPFTEEVDLLSTGTWNPWSWQEFQVPCHRRSTFSVNTPFRKKHCKTTIFYKKNELIYTYIRYHDIPWYTLALVYHSRLWGVHWLLDIPETMVRVHPEESPTGAPGHSSICRPFHVLYCTVLYI